MEISFDLQSVGSRTFGFVTTESYCLVIFYGLNSRWFRPTILFCSLVNKKHFTLPCSQIKKSFLESKLRKLSSSLKKTSSAKPDHIQSSHYLNYILSPFVTLLLDYKPSHRIVLNLVLKIRFALSYSQ